MTPLVIIGAGGHAKVLVESIRAARWFSIAGSVSADGMALDSMDVPCLGADEALPGIWRDGVRHCVVAVGDNRRRQHLAHLAHSIGFIAANVIHPTAVISPSVRLGRGIAIMAGAVVNAAVQIGDGAIVNTRASVDHDCVLAAFSHVGPGASLCGGVAVGEGALVGVGSAVAPAVRIGAWSIIGAGSAVVRDIPGAVTAYGAPARVRTPAKEP